MEIAKARLRSRSTYSPVEKLLQRALENYKKELDSINKAREDDDQAEKGEENQKVLKPGESHHN